jgi:hypothetical protein
LTHDTRISRRRVLQSVALGALAPLVARQRVSAADAPLIAESDPAARAVRYVADVSRAKGAKPGNTCANCALYQGPSGSVQGPCQILPGKQVKAAGWCASWAPQI